MSVLEIDGVRAALSHGTDWELHDMLADSYLRVVDLGTARDINSSGRLVLQLCLQTLANGHSTIIRTLSQNEDVPGLSGVTLAYTQTLQQITGWTGQQG